MYRANIPPMPGKHSPNGEGWCPPLCAWHRVVKQEHQGKRRECREGRICKTGRARALGGKRVMGTAAYEGKGLKERTRVSGERPMGAARFRQQTPLPHPATQPSLGLIGLKARAARPTVTGAMLSRGITDNFPLHLTRQSVGTPPEMHTKGCSSGQTPPPPGWGIPSRFAKGRFQSKL